MMTVEQVQQMIDARLNAQLNRIRSAQAAHKDEHGRYWQGLPTHAEPPRDGSDVDPDRWNDKAPGHSLSWRDIGGVSNRMMSQMWIDIYNGPQGKGYVVTLRFRHGLDEWTRSINTGPETFKEQPWTKVIPIP